jgi:hypothetical protein
LCAVLLYRYYWHKLQQLSRLTQQHEDEEEGEEGEEREHEAMDGEFGGGGSLSLDPGWAGQLQSIAAYLRLLDLEVCVGQLSWQAATAACVTAAGTLAAVPAHALCSLWSCLYLLLLWMEERKALLVHIAHLAA